MLQLEMISVFLKFQFQGLMCERDNKREERQLYN
jgi:hypothetical protein